MLNIKLRDLQVQKMEKAFLDTYLSEEEKALLDKVKYKSFGLNKDCLIELKRRLNTLRHRNRYHKILKDSVEKDAFVRRTEKNRKRAISSVFSYYRRGK